METDIFGIDKIIRKCDRAFDCPVAARKYYPDLLQKIHRFGRFLYAYGKDVMGYVALYANDFDTNTAYISLLAVLPEYQNSHIGSNLLKTAMEMALSYGMESCMLEVGKKNGNAIRFYQSKGFVFRKEKEESILLDKDLARRETYEYQREESNFTGNGTGGL